MGRNLSVLTGPRSSIGSPVTLRIRPRVAAPTGMVMGAPVSVTLKPRTRPSVPVEVESVHRCVRISPTSTYRPWQCIGRHSDQDVAVFPVRLSFQTFVGCSTYSDLEHKLLAVVGGLKGVQNRRQLSTVELDYRGISLHRILDDDTMSARCRIALTVDDGTNDLIVVVSQIAGHAGFTRRAHLVDLAITSTLGARESLGGRAEDGGRANGATSGGREGRASRPGGKGGNAARAKNTSQSGAQLTSIVRRTGRIVARKGPRGEAYLLNILGDGRERSDVGAERRWMKLRRTLQDEQISLRGGRLGR